MSSSSLSLYAGAYVSFLIEINVYFLRYHTFVQWSQLSDGFKKSYDFVTDPAFLLLLKKMGFMLFQDSHIISKVWSHMCLKINTCKSFIFRQIYYIMYIKGTDKWRKRECNPISI